MKVIIISIIAAISISALVLGFGLGYGLAEDTTSLDSSSGDGSDSSDSSSSTEYTNPRSHSNVSHQVNVSVQNLTTAACLYLYARRSNCANQYLQKTPRACGCNYNGGIYNYVDCNANIYYWDCSPDCGACNELIAFDTCYGTNNNAKWSEC